MTDYRAVVDHVGYWRGTIHRWSTSYSFTGSGTTPNTAACQTLLTADDKMCFSPSTTSGGTYECRIYKTSGGTPIATYTAFDWSIPGDWIRYASTYWTAPHTGTCEAALEVALQVEWPAGVSSTGKPVYFRKWYHAVKTSVNTAGDAGGDMLTADVTSLTTGAEAVATCLAPTYGLVMGNAGRLAGTTPTVNLFYGNHQIPKGRKRKPTTFSLSGGGSVSIAPGKYPAPIEIPAE